MDSKQKNLEKARETQKQKNETKKMIDGKLQNVVEHQNGKYVKIGECKSFYIYQNLSLGSVETIDSSWKYFPSNEGFGTKPFDHCFSNIDNAKKLFKTIECALFNNYEEILKKNI